MDLALEVPKCAFGSMGGFGGVAFPFYRASDTFQAHLVTFGVRAMPEARRGSKEEGHGKAIRALVCTSI